MCVLCFHFRRSRGETTNKSHPADRKPIGASPPLKGSLSPLSRVPSLVFSRPPPHSLPCPPLRYRCPVSLCLGLNSRFFSAFLFGALSLPVVICLVFLYIARIVTLCVLSAFLAGVRDSESLAASPSAYAFPVSLLCLLNLAHRLSFSLCLFRLLREHSVAPLRRWTISSQFAMCASLPPPDRFESKRLLKLTTFVLLSDLRFERLNSEPVCTARQRAACVRLRKTLQKTRRKYSAS